MSDAPPPDITNFARGDLAVVPALLAVDLDGTCLDDQLRLNPRVRHAIRSVAIRVPVVIATGRMYRSASPWADELQASAPLITYQGALVRESPSRGGEVISTELLPADVAKHAIHTARREGWHRQAFVNDQLYCEEDRPEVARYTQIAQVEAWFVDDLETVIDGGVLKLVIVVPDAGEADRCESLLRLDLRGAARVTRSLPHLIELVAPKVGKGTALVRLCEMAGINLASVVAVGDAPNDIDLLDVAGFAVAVRTAPQSLLMHADATCAPPDEAGVADVIDALFGA